MHLSSLYAIIQSSSTTSTTSVQQEADAFRERDNLRDKKRMKTNIENGLSIGTRETLPNHIPSFLPPLPYHHTYATSHQHIVKRNTNGVPLRLNVLDQKRKMEHSLSGLLHLQFQCKVKKKLKRFEM